MAERFHPDPPVAPPGAPPPACGCFDQRGRTLSRVKHLHSDPQDTSCDAWKKVVESVESVLAAGGAVFEPLAGLSADERAQIVSLPASIGSLAEVREMKLYGSNLVRLPPEIGGMSSLRSLDVYTSRRLHFFPYELTHCSKLRDSRVSTRAIYGNYKHRPPFPALEQDRNREALALATPAACSICSGPLDRATVLRRWITLQVGSDWLPLLTHACSQACLERLPKPADGYIPVPHSGGPGIDQPPPDEP